MAAPLIAPRDKFHGPVGQAVQVWPIITVSAAAYGDLARMLASYVSNQWRDIRRSESIHTARALKPARTVISWKLSMVYL